MADMWRINNCLADMRRTSVHAAEAGLAEGKKVAIANENFAVDWRGGLPIFSCGGLAESAT